MNTVSPGTFLSAAFTENLRPILGQGGSTPEDPYDAMNVDRRGVRLAVRPRARRARWRRSAAVIAFLVSRRNSYMTGANVNVDGGSDFC